MDLRLGNQAIERATYLTADLSYVKKRAGIMNMEEVIEIIFYMVRSTITWFSAHLAHVLFRKENIIVSCMPCRPFFTTIRNPFRAKRKLHGIPWIT